MHVFVVGWHPSVGSGANGGFEWRYSREAALGVLLQVTADELTNVGPHHNIVFAEIAVPFEVDHNRPRTYDDREHEITAWLDENLSLFELPLQEEAHA